MFDIFKNFFRINSSIPNDSVPFGTIGMPGFRSGPALKSVCIHGDVTGTMFNFGIRQEYKNETDDVLEIVYTFPVAWGTALLGMSADMNGKRREGVVVEKKEAEDGYEKSVLEGNSAVLLQKSAPGLYTANLGNIGPGESVGIEIRCSRLLHFEQGRIRLCIPTVIGERYGDAHGAGGLAPHESAHIDPAVRYPLSLDLTLKGSLARGNVASPTHNITCTETEQGLSVRPAAGAALDRDFVLLVEELPGNSTAHYVKEDDGYMILASFSPVLNRQEAAPLGLKILVDCSGSMQGERIVQAQQGLRQVFALLKPHDHVSYSCFGTSIRHFLTTMRSCSADVMQNLADSVRSTNANMGGTELKRAILSTVADIEVPPACEGKPAILLITDGDVWQVQDVLSTVEKSGHRIFVVGVGFAPSHHVLQELAEQSGGACELVTPGESMQKAVVRMFHRMRCAVASNVRVDWGQEPVWKSALPRYLYDGETVHCFAVLQQAPTTCPVLTWTVQDGTRSARADRLEATHETALLRLGMMRRMEESNDEQEKLHIALKYQLLSDQTSLFLVCERDEGGKLEGLPKVHHVPQMPEHVFFERTCCFEKRLPSHARMDSAEGHAVCSLKNSFACACESSKCLSKQSLPDITEKIRACVEGRRYESSGIVDMLANILNDGDMVDWKHFVREMEAVTQLTEEQIWAILVEFLLERTYGKARIDRHLLRILNFSLKGASKSDIDTVRKQVGLFL